MGHQLTPGQVEELEDLMREYPDWAQTNPDIAASVQQPRLHRNRKFEEKTAGRVIPRRATTVPKSDYQAMYVPHVPRPRSSKRPPPVPAPTVRPPMAFSTNQRDEFGPKDPSVRPRPVVMTENYEHPTGAFSSDTSYKQAYVPIEIKPYQTQHPHPGITDGQLQAHSRHQPTFSGKTTNKESYKKWVTKPALKFTELPTLSGSLLYPDPGHQMESTTKTTYQGQPADRVKLIPHSHDHIQLEGSHSMSTTTHSTYHNFANPQPATKVVRRPQLPVHGRDPFQATSQSQADYGSCYRTGMPVPQQPVVPHPETIELRFNDQSHFRTEQQSQYPGIDVATHPPPRPIMPEPENHTGTAGVSMQTETSSRHDYKAHDVRPAFPPPVKTLSEAERRQNLPAFHAETSSQHFYRHWPVEARRRYVDFHEGHKYMPPRDKFNATSTTRTAYAGAPGHVAPAYVPTDSGALRAEGRIDFGTVYTANYSGKLPLKKLNKEQMAKLLSDLRRRKHQEGQFTEQQVVFAPGVGAT